MLPSTEFAVSAAAFEPATRRLLDRAEQICQQRGVRLTELRRFVLGLVLDSPAPAGAYDMLDRLRQHHKGAAPPTMYRALDFLLDQGLIHKVERLSAYVGCVHGLDHHASAEACEHQAHSHAHSHAHAVQFLICRNCKRVIELEEPEISQALLRAAKRHGFQLNRSMIEAEGLCAACSGAA